MTLAEEKEALKRKLQEIENRKKKPPKYKKEPKDILNDPKGKVIKIFISLNSFQLCSKNIRTIQA